MCKNPTEEDRKWFPNIAGGDWLEQVTYAMKNFKDEGFLLQYLSPKVMRDMQLFDLVDDQDKKYWYEIENIHNEAGYKRLREAINKQYMRDAYIPDIQIDKVDRQDRTLTLTYTSHDDVTLDVDDAYTVLEHINYLWGFPVILEHHFEDENVEICSVGMLEK